jgi:flagellin
MRAQIRGLDKAAANAQDAISLVQTAEGSLDSSTEILQRMHELAVQASSDTNEDIDRGALQDEFEQLQSELDDIAKNTTFNKKNLLDGSLATTKTSIGGSTAMATGNLSASVGNAAAGMYNFNVSVVKTADAVAAKKADTLTVSKDTLSSYISSATGDMSGINDASSLLNGNYTISDVSYNDEAGSFTLTAKGGSDGNQTFTATVNMNALDTSTTHTITADFTDAPTPSPLISTLPPTRRSTTRTIKSTT